VNGGIYSIFSDQNVFCRQDLKSIDLIYIDY